MLVCYSDKANRLVDSGADLEDLRSGRVVFVVVFLIVKKLSTTITNMQTANYVPGGGSKHPPCTIFSCSIQAHHTRGGNPGTCARGTEEQNLVMAV